MKKEDPLGIGFDFDWLSTEGLRALLLPPAVLLPVTSPLPPSGSLCW